MKNKAAKIAAKSYGEANARNYFFNGIIASDTLPKIIKRPKFTSENAIFDVIIQHFRGL